MKKKNDYYEKGRGGGESHTINALCPSLSIDELQRMRHSMEGNFCNEIDTVHSSPSLFPI